MTFGKGRRSINRRRVHQWVRWLHSGGNLTFGIAAAIQPRRVAELIGETEEEVRRIVVRDLRNGFTLMTAPDPLWPLLGAMRSDATEALGWLRRNPRLALFPMLWVALGMVAILTRD